MTELNSNIKIKSIYTLFFLFLMLIANMTISGYAYASPAITGVPTTIASGQSITITGSGFGSGGPSVLFFDNFESGTVGQDIKTGTGSATIGKWASLNSVPPVYSSDTSVSGTKAFKVTTKAGIEGRTNGFISLPDTTQIFISWWMYVPTSSPWPGEGMSNGINWKTMWMYQSNTSTNDLVMPSMLGTSTTVNDWYITGNNSPYQHEMGTAPSLTKGQWRRFWVWVKDGYSRDGDVSLWELRSTGVNQLIQDTNVTTAVSGDVRNTLSVNGYTREMTGTQATQMYDDIYVATGPNAQARVELGTGCTGGAYTACTDLAVSTVNSWSDSTITATARLGNLSGDAYVFVIDANGNVSSGKPVSLATTQSVSSTSSTAPTPPQNLRIVQ